MNALFPRQFFGHTAERFFLTPFALFRQLFLLGSDRYYHTVIFARQHGIIKYLQKLVKFKMRILLNPAELHIADF